MSYLRKGLAVLSYSLCIAAIARGQDGVDARLSAVDSPERLAWEDMEVYPKLIYLLDKQGRPTIPYLDFPWEKFNVPKGELEPNRVPNFLLSEMQLDAQVEQNKARIGATLVIRCLIDGPQLVPIKMGNAHFQTQPTANNGTEVRARYVTEFDEYELLVSGEKGQDVAVKFTMVAPLKTVGSTTRLKLSLPRTAVARMQLEIPAEQLTGSAGRRLTFRQEVLDGSTTFHFEGLVEDFEFQWQPQQTSEVEASAAFEVEGLIDIRIDSRGSVSTEAELRIAPFNQAIERVRVRLPENAYWSDADSNAEAYSIISLGKTTDERRELEILFAEATTSPPPIRLLVESDRVENLDEASYKLASFEVVDASSQFGTVNVYAAEDHKYDWVVGEYAQRISTEPEAQATFAYYQPNQITMLISRQPREVAVEPLYLVTISKNEAKLNAIFRCSSGGANVANLRIDLAGWTYDGLGRDTQNLVADREDFRVVDGRVEIALTEATNTFQIGILATLPFNGSLDVVESGFVGTPDTILDLQFPQAENVDKLLRSTVAILTDSDVVVAPTPNTTAYSAIGPPQRVLDELDVDARPACFRMRSVGRPAAFQLAMARLERTVEVNSETDVLEVSPDAIRIQSRMQWRIKDVPLHRVLLSIHKKIDSADPAFSINGVSVSSAPYPRFGDSLVDRVIIQIPLNSEPGDFELTAVYDWYPEESSLDEVLVELIVPSRSSPDVVENLEFSNRLRRPRVQGYDITLSPQGNASSQLGWETSGLNGGDFEATTDSLLQQLPLRITQVGTSEESTPFEELVDQSWYQTWYTDSERTDRAVFRVRGADRSLRITMPEDTNYNKLHAWIDGRKAEYVRDGSSTIALNIGPVAPYHVVELRYASERDPRSLGLLEVQPPTIEGAEMIGQWYWHLVIPRHESLISWPRSLTRAHRWDWSTLIPRVRPQLSQTELENWSGAMQVKSNVLLGSNEYLFGAMGKPNELRVRTFPLSLYVLVTAGSMLVFGLLILQAQRQRRLWYLTIVGLLIAATMVIHPSYGAIAGQVVVLGTALVVLAGVLRWLFRGASLRSLQASEPLSTRVLQQNVVRSHSGSSIPPPRSTTPGTLPTATSGSESRR